MMINKRIGVSVLAIVGAVVALPLRADVIVDPDSVGDRRVSGSSGDSTSLYVGYGGSDGALEINSNGTETSLTRRTVVIGQYGDTGLLRIVGDGTSGSAQLNVTPGFGLRNGLGGNGTLEVLQGGVVHSEENVYLGNQAACCNTIPGDATTTVDGAGSVLRTQQSSEGESWQRDGGRIYVGFDGQSDSTVNIRNGGRVEALNGQAGDDGDDGSVWVGVSNSEGSTAIVNIDGDGSTLLADNHISVGQRTDLNTQAQINVTNGGALQVGPAADGSGKLVVSDIEGNAEVNVRGTDPSSAAQARVDADEIQLGGRGYIRGYTSSGEVVTDARYDDSNLVAGEQITDIDGNKLYDQFGAPIIATERSIGDFSFVTAEPVFVKNTGNMTVEDNAVVNSVGDIHVSVPTFDSAVNKDLSPLRGQSSVLTVRNDGRVNATNVIVNTDGRLQGGEGTINANVIVNGGVVAPGNSPGTMNILGDFVLNDGFLNLEFDPFGASDILRVGGDAFFGEDAIINITMTDVFSGLLDFDSFFDVAGVLSFDPGFSAVNNIMFDVAGQSGVFNFQFGNELFKYSSGTLALVDGGGSGSVPAPSSLVLLMLGLWSLSYVRRTRTSF